MSARCYVLCIVLFGCTILTPATPQSTSSSSKSGGRDGQLHTRRESELDPGAVTNGVYRNKSVALSYKIPEGWVLRTEEMNAPNEGADDSGSSGPAQPASSAGARVLLAAFSRPPQASGQDVNSSIVIAAESASNYPGLKDASQYFGPLTEVAKAQGFAVDEEPYEVAIGTKILVRGDFHRDVGSRVMRQSTLAMLSHGYAVSITVIGGTEDEVEGLIDRLSFAGK